MLDFFNNINYASQMTLTIKLNFKKKFKRFLIAVIMNNLYDKCLVFFQNIFF